VKSSGGRSFVLPAAVQRTVRFVVALGLIIYEAVIYEGSPRLLLLGVYLTMMGLPVAEWGDELRRAASDRLGRGTEE
jgi:hypothetical protein